MTLFHWITVFIFVTRIALLVICLEFRQLNLEDATTIGRPFLSPCSMRPASSDHTSVQSVSEKGSVLKSCPSVFSRSGQD